MVIFVCVKWSTLVVVTKFMFNIRKIHNRIFKILFPINCFIWVTAQEIPFLLTPETNISFIIWKSILENCSFFSVIYEKLLVRAPNNRSQILHAEFQKKKKIEHVILFLYVELYNNKKFVGKMWVDSNGDSWYKNSIKTFYYFMLFSRVLRLYHST